MKTLAFCFTLILLTACQTAAVPAAAVPALTPTLPALTNTLLPTPTVPPTRSPTAAPSQTPTMTRTPTVTLTPTITLTAIITPTPTLGSGHAPTLEPLPVNFIKHGPRDQRLVALTFDLCQKPEIPAWFDKKIYQALVDSNTRATFFMGGDWMRTHITETRLLAANPLFELGNHSYSHPDLPDLDADQISREVIKTQDMLYHITGRQPRIFRLPAGKYNDLVLATIAQRGLSIIQWDADTADPVPDNSAENIQRLVKERVQTARLC